MPKTTIFARNENIGTSDTFVSPNGVNVFLPSVSGIVEVLSDDSNDTIAGTGARTVYVYGLDENYEAISEIIQLNGTTPVESIKSYLRINNFFVETSGNSSCNEGSVIIRDKLSGNIHREIEPNFSWSQSSLYTVPIGQNARISKIFVNTGKGRDIVVKLLSKDSSTTYVRGAIDLFENNSMIELDEINILTEKTDLYLNAHSRLPNTVVSVLYILKIDDI